MARKKPDSEMSFAQEALRQWTARDVPLGFYGRVSPRRLMLLNELQALTGTRIGVPKLPTESEQVSEQ